MNGHASLNRCYRHVWSEATRSWMVAPETARRAGKGGRARRVMQAVMGVLASVVLSGGMSTLTHAQQAPPSATQLPVVNAVARGQVNITQTNTANTSAMNVNQASQSAVINWNTFNVGQSAQVNFNQPNSSAVTLNRVLDNNPSQVWGRITAPGQVFISNANGVYFSPTSSVDVGALTATTHNISDDDFMSGKRTFTRDGATGKVINEGNLKAALGGYVALLAPEVQNAGVIVAQAGTVALAAGEAITLNFDPSQKLTGITTTPSTIASLVENKLAVLAPDGHIVLSAVAMNKLHAGVVKNNGRLEASSMVSKGGTIVLEGDDITLERNSKLEATGPTGGGTVLVGGDWQGSGDVRPATRVTMQEGATINASATENGDGGKVVLWSDVQNADSVTQVAGTIQARGGEQGGDGGRIETSGHVLKVNPSKGDASAPHGRAGEWLFDPYDVTITSADANGGFTSTAGTDTWDPSATGSTLDAAALVAKLNAGTNVTVTTTGAGSDAGNITVASALTGWTASTLSLNAHHDVRVNAAISGTGTSALVLTPDMSVSNGAIVVAADISTGANQTYAGNVSLTNANTTFASVSGNLSFNGKVDGASHLTTTVASAGSVTFKDSVGSVTPLTSLTAGAGTVILDPGLASISTSADQIYGADLTLNPSAVTLNSTAGNLTFNGKVDGASKLTTTVLNANAVSFNGLVGSVTPLQSISVNGGATGSANLGADLVTTGDQVFDAKVSLVSDVALTASTGSISFKGTVDSGSALNGGYSLSPAVGASGILVFNNAVGGTTPLRTLQTGALGLSYINAPITTTGIQTYNNDVIVGVIGSPPFNNGGFESSSVGAITASNAISGWTVFNQGVRFNGLSTIGGFATPVDTTYPTSVQPGCVKVSGTGCDSPGSMTYTSQIVSGVATPSDGTRAIQLTSTGSSPGFGIVRGPYLISNSSVALGNGDRVTFKWRATGGSDAADVYGYLLNTATGATVKLLDVTTASAGDTTYSSWQTVTQAVTGPTANYKFVFVSGSWDATGGSALGANLYVDSVGTVSNNVSLFNSTTCSVCTVTASAATFAKSINLGSSTAKLNVANASSIAGEVTGAGSLYKDGAGTLTLSAVNSYGGATTVHAGVLLSGVAGALPDTSAITVDSGGTLDMNGNNDVVGSIAGPGPILMGSAALSAGADNTSTTYSGILSGTGTFTKTGTGTLTLSGVNSYTGATTVSGGTLAVSATTGLGTNAAGTTVATGGTLDLQNITGVDEALTLSGGTLKTSTGTTTVVTNVVLGANSTVDVSGTGLTLANPISGAGFGITKTGAGALTLSGANTYTGITTVNAGSLVSGAADVIADASAVTVGTGATWNLNNNTETIGSLAGAGTVALGSANLTAGGNNTATTFSGGITGTGAFTKTGTGALTLSGANTYTGATTISGGTLTHGVADALSDSTTVSVASGATWNLNNFNDTVASFSGSGAITLGSGTLIFGADNSSNTYAGTMSGTGSLTQTGTGTLTVTGNNTFSGVTTIGSGASVLVTGTGNLSGSGVINSGTFDITGTTTGSSVRYLAGSGSFNRGGKLLDRTGVDFGNIDMADITDWMTYGNVTILADATHDVTINTSPTSNTPVTGTGRIYVNSPVSLAGNFKLGFNAATQTAINRDIDLLGASSGLIFTNKNDALSLATGAKINVTGASATLNIGNTNYSFVRTAADFTGMTANGSYALVNDLDLSATTYSSAVYTSTFTGNFDGLGNKINGLTIRNSGTGVQNLGLFAQLQGAGVRNLGLSNVDIQTSATSAGASGTEYRIGALAGNVGNAALTTGFAASAYTTTIDGVWSNGIISTADTSISDSASAGDRQKFMFAGGLVGSHNNGTLNIVRSYSAARVSSVGSYSDNLAIGGLVGDVGINRLLASHTTATATQLAFALSNSYTTGSVLAGGHGSYFGTGGVIGVAFTAGMTVSNTYSWGNAVSNGSFGGIAGFTLAGGSYSNSYTTQSVAGSGVTGTNLYTSQVATAGTTLPTGFSAAYWSKANNALPILSDLPTPPTPLYVKVTTGTSQYGETLSAAYSVVDSAGAEVTLANLGLATPTGMARYTLGGTPNASTYSLSYLGGLTLGGANAAGYTLNPYTTAGTYTITPRVLTVTGSSVAGKVYDNTATTTATVGTLSGFLGQETVTATGVGAFTDVNAGSRTATITYSLSNGTNNGLATNYSLSPTTGHTATISPANLVLTGTKVYDGATSVAGLNLTGTGLNGNSFAITGVGDASNLASRFVQQNSPLTSVTGLAIGASSNGGISSNYQLSVLSSSVSVTPKPITISGFGIASKVYDGNTTATIGSAGTVPGVYAGDDVSIDTSAFVGVFDNKNVGTAHTVTVSGLGIGGNQRNNYSFTAPTTALGTITRLNSVTWTGGATGNWFDPANWAGGAVPDLANVANVVIPSGVTATFGSTVVSPAVAGTVQIDSINPGGASGGLSMTAGNLQVGSGGANLSNFSQVDGTLAVAGNLSVTQSFSQAATGSVAVTGNASVTDTSGGLTLGALTVAGNLGLSSTGGNITQVPGTALAVTGVSNLIARNGAQNADIVLSELANHFQGAVSADGSAVTLQDSGSLILGAITSSGALNVTAGSHITQTGALQATGASSLTAASGDITLNNANNSFAAPLSVSGANISLQAASALPLGTVTATGNMALASNGSITQTGALAVSGTSTIGAGAGDILLLNASNDFAGTVSAAGANIGLRDANALTLSALTSSGNSDITSHGALSFGATSVRGNLAVVSGNGTISQTQTMGVSGAASFNAGSGAVALSDGANVFGATPQIQAASSNVSSGGPYNLASAIGSDPQKPILSGMAPANTTVSVFDNGTLLGTTTADNTGAWRYEPTTFMIPGNHIITASSASAVGVSGLSSPLPILVNARFDTPNMVGSALQTQQSQSQAAAAVTPPGGLQQGQSPLVQVTQLSSMSPQQLQAMTPLQTALLSPAQLSSLEPTQLASLSPSQFQALQPAQVAQLAPAQLAQLSGPQVAAISHAGALSVDQIQALSPNQVASVQPTQFARLNAAQMASFGDAQLQSLTPVQVAAMAPSQFAALTSEQVTAMGPTLTQSLSPQQFGGLTALQLISLSDAQVSAVSPAQLQQLNPMQRSVITPEQKAAMNPLQLLALGETAGLQVSALSPQELGNFTAQQVQNLQPEHLQSLSGLQIRAFTPEHIEAMSFSQVSALSPVQLQALTSQQITSLSVAQAASLSDSQLAVMSPGQLNALPKGGALPITVLGAASAPAAGIEFEKRADVVEVRVTDMVPAAAAASSASMSTVLSVFTVTTADNQTVEFKGAINDKQLMIAAPTEQAKALTRSDLAQIMKVALKKLGGDKAVDPTDLSGIILDLR